MMDLSNFQIHMYSNHLIKTVVFSGVNTSLLAHTQTTGMTTVIYYKLTPEMKSKIDHFVGKVGKRNAHIL